MMKRTRRSPEQQIADLQAKIQALKQRAEQKKALKDPAMKHVKAALRSIDRALAEAKDATLKKTLGEAREVLANGASSNGQPFPISAGAATKRRKRSSSVKADPAYILRVLKGNRDGMRCEDIANELDLDSTAVSPTLKALKEDGKVETEGQARGTRYFVGR